MATTSSAGRRMCSSSLRRATRSRTTSINAAPNKYWSLYVDFRLRRPVSVAGIVAVEKATMRFVSARRRLRVVREHPGFSMGRASSGRSSISCCCAHMPPAEYTWPPTTTRLCQRVGRSPADSEFVFTGWLLNIQPSGAKLSLLARVVDLFLEAKVLPSFQLTGYRADRDAMVRRCNI